MTEEKIYIQLLDGSTAFVPVNATKLSDNQYKILDATGYPTDNNCNWGWTNQTIRRKEYVEKFQKNSEYPYFVLSLKAGGSGINLTEAAVISIRQHLDTLYTQLEKGGVPAGSSTASRLFS